MVTGQQQLGRKNVILRFFIYLPGKWYSVTSSFLLLTLSFPISSSLGLTSHFLCSVLVPMRRCTPKKASTRRSRLFVRYRSPARWGKTTGNTLCSSCCWQHPLLVCRLLRAVTSVCYWSCCCVFHAVRLLLLLLLSSYGVMKDSCGFLFPASISPRSSWWETSQLERRVWSAGEKLSLKNRSIRSISLWFEPRCVYN